MASQPLFLGETVDASGSRTGARVDYDPGRFTTHGVIVGMTGSGKTGLGVVMLEELLRQQIPCLIIDPKGDMGNLALTFPELRGEDFTPWVDPGEAKREGIEIGELGQRKAGLWKNGLAGWGLGSPELAALHESAPVSIYTPGSSAGRSLNVLGSLRAPGGDFDAAAEQLHDEIEGFVSGLLGLIGVAADPLSSREHILLSNLIEKSWRAGRDLDLAGLIGQVHKPPLRKLGVFEVDAFFPEADRLQLAMRINGLLANPGFAKWLEGDAVDVGRLLWTPEGKARASIVYLSHLSPEERQFVVTLLLSKVATWMQTQPGSSELRALVYMDEVFGFCPPSAAPPAKKPILTLLKQARAFGVGMVLSTQNPVDLDYKAMSNAGTWMIGRLQTERDKARILEGLSSAAGEVDVATLDKQLSGLGKRQFLLHSTKDSQPRLFTTRWAMNYLRGPLTKDEVGRLTAADPMTSSPAAKAPATTAPAAPAPAPAAAPETAAPTTAVPEAEPLAEDESPTEPSVADNIGVYYLDPAASWAEEVGARAQAKRYEPALCARVHLKFDETKAELDHDVEWEAVFFPLEDPVEPERGLNVDYDQRDFDKRAPEGIRWAQPAVKLQNKTFFKSFERQLKDWLYREEKITLFRNTKLKAYSRIGETRDDFASRCQEIAVADSEDDKRKLHAKIEKKVKSAQKAIETAERQLAKAEADASAQKRHEAVSGIGSMLSVFFGGGSKKSLAKRAAGKAGGFSSRRTASAKAAARVDQAEDKIEDKQAELESLETELIEELEAIEAKWLERAEAIEDFEVGLEKGDIRVEEIAVVWVGVD